VRILTQLRATLSHWACRGLPGHYIAVLILTLENDLVVDQQLASMVLMSLLAYRQQAVTRKQLRGTLSSLGYRAPARRSPRPSSILAAIGVSGSNPVGGYYYSIATMSRSLD
jgi:hypothetical protein